MSIPLGIHIFIQVKYDIEKANVANKFPLAFQNVISKTNDQFKDCIHVLSTKTQLIMQF